MCVSVSCVLHCFVFNSAFLICCCCLPICLFPKERKGMERDGWGGEKDWGQIEGAMI